MTSDNTKLTYIEWSEATVEEFEEDQYAPPSGTLFPRVYDQWDYDVGSVPDVEFFDISFDV